MPEHKAWILLNNINWWKFWMILFNEYLRKHLSNLCTHWIDSDSPDTFMPETMSEYYRIIIFDENIE